MLGAGDRVVDANGEPSDLINDRWIYLTEEEYRHVLDYLREKGAIDAEANRIDGKAEDSQEPWTNDDNN